LGRAPTAIARRGAWRWRVPRSRAGNHLPKLLRRPVSLTKATWRVSSSERMAWRPVAGGPSLETRRERRSL